MEPAIETENCPIGAELAHSLNNYSVSDELYRREEQFQERGRYTSRVPGAVIDP